MSHTSADPFLESTQFINSNYQGISYGTFFPRPLVTVDLINSECEVVESHSKREAGDFSCPSFYKKSRQCSSESGFESDYTWKCSPLPLHTSLPHSIAPSWESLYLAAMERNLSQAEQELKNISSAEDEGFSEENLDIISTVVTVNTESIDYNLIEIKDNFVSDVDTMKRCKSAFGILCRLKRMLESDCAKLDRLVGMGVPNQDEPITDENRVKGDLYRGRLTTCLSEVDRKMENIQCTNEIVIDGVRHSGSPYGNPIIKKIRNSPVKCLTWVCVALFISIMLMLCFMFIWNGFSDQWVIYLRLIRSPLIIIFLLYLYGVNMKVWAKYGIDYVSVFNHNPNSTPTPAYIFSMAGFLTVVFSGLVVALIVASPFTVILPIKIIPLIMWLVILGLFFNPFKIFQRKIRFNFISVFVHILLAPFVFVFFTDFFLADQFNSTVAVFLDVHYTWCYFISDSWSGEVDTVICTSSSNGIRPIISFLPAMWRLFQCLRCYYDTYNVKHLINAGKYVTTFPVIIFAAVYAAKVKGNGIFLSLSEDTKWIFIFWGIFSLIQALYTFLWDVCCDWGLWDVLRCKVFHRPLLYRYKVLYILAILLDFVLRFLWTVKLTLAIVWQADSDLIYTGKWEVS